MPDTPEHQPVENKPQRTARERPPLIEQIQIFGRRLVCAVYGPVWCCSELSRS